MTMVIIYFVLESHLQNDQGNFPLVENPNTCQEDNTACSDPCNETLLFRKPEFVWGNLKV